MTSYREHSDSERPLWVRSHIAESRDEVDAAVAFCPTSNLFLGSGLFPLSQCSRAGVRTGLGTDVGGGTSYSLLTTLNEAYKVVALGNAYPERIPDDRRMTLTALRSFYLATLGDDRAVSHTYLLGYPDAVTPRSADRPGPRRGAPARAAPAGRAARHRPALPRSCRGADHPRRETPAQGVGERRSNAPGRRTRPMGGTPLASNPLRRNDALIHCRARPGARPPRGPDQGTSAIRPWNQSRSGNRGPAELAGIAVLPMFKAVRPTVGRAGPTRWCWS
ncbi:hypothetical protein GCM10009634_33800 [Saccharothrix xinjiangensis]